MDWNAAIDKHRAALKRIVASLAAMAGLAGAAASSRSWRADRLSPGREGVVDFGSPQPPHASRQLPRAGQAVAGPGASDAAARAEGEPRPTLPRHLHRAVLRLLRPAESAARRLVIAAACGLAEPPQAGAEETATLPSPTPRKPQPAILRGRVGTGILMPAGFRALGSVPQPRRAAALYRPAEPGAGEGVVRRQDSQSAIGEGQRDGRRPARRLPLPLVDPPRRRGGRRRPATSGVPRIWTLGAGAPFPVPVRRPLSPDDPIDATRLVLRVAALASALDDLPGQARRFARLRRRAAARARGINNHAEGSPGRAAGPLRRNWPLRRGRPPGQRPARSSRPAHEIDSLLGDLHWLACEALQTADTS